MPQIIGGQISSGILIAHNVCIYELAEVGGIGKLLILLGYCLRYLDSVGCGNRNCGGEIGWCKA